MSERMFGFETEYAFSALDRRGGRLSRGLATFMKLAHERLPHLRGMSSSGIFLANGSRFYVDCRSHPEMTTPECVDPTDIVRYVAAGERILADVASALVKKSRAISRVLIWRANVDYGGNCCTWGRHESHLHRMRPEKLPPDVVPHLVSRLVFTGAGGFNNRSPGIEYLVSPRVPHLTTTISPHSTANRGIFHTKDESLSGKGYHRLHILCGESLCGHRATWLSVATTALVVAMAEAGIAPGKDVALADSLAAINTFARDPECSAEVRMSDGRKLTALDIQRHYLQLAERNVERAFMPWWAEEACQRWRSMLRDLESGREKVRATLDWAIKLDIVERHMRRRGFDWTKVSRWNDIMTRLQAALKSAGADSRQLDAEFVLSSTSPLVNEVAALTPRLREGGLAWEELAKFLALRAELFEIDLQFGRIDDEGIFSALDRQPGLDHAVSGVDPTSVREATETPPATGRAHLRGECVRRHAGNTAVTCDWHGVWDGKRMLDLNEPFATKGEWSKLERTSPP